jgi:LysR family transcriptional regulator, regulator for bpeEF and oprC
MPMRFQKGGERSEIGGVHGMGINESNGHVAAELASLGVIQTFSFAARNAIARGELVPCQRGSRIHAPSSSCIRQTGT